MDDNNIEVRKELGEETEQSGAMSARDAWHAKNMNRRQAESAGYRSAYGKNAFDNSEDEQVGKKVNAGKKKPIIIFACIVIGVLILAGLLSIVRGSVPEGRSDISGASGVRGDYIGVLCVEGTIGSDDETYSQSYMIDAVEGMIKNDDNRGMLLFVNTPGGSVYESDELYLKIKEYQKTTGRPVYAYFASQATSGGYYISASADKIAANRNCWTGSIGVTIGTLVDISELLENYGIKTETITSGENKAMGSITDPMTAEQKDIFQSLVDEAYEQFVSIVAEGRELDTDYVKSIADGRIYTAKQAKKIGLVDEVVYDYQEAVTDMMSEYDLFNCDVYEFRYEPDYGLFGNLIKSMDNLADAFSNSSDISAISELMEDGGEVPLQYICPEIK